MIKMGLPEYDDSIGLGTAIAVGTSNSSASSGINDRIGSEYFGLLIGASLLVQLAPRVCLSTPGLDELAGLLEHLLERVP